MAETTPLVHSVLHATRILELYAAQRRKSLSLTEISKALGLHKTTVYRLLRTLQHAGWIEQSAKTGKYYLGTGILLVASAVSVHNTSRDLLSQEMHRLAETFNETVVLSVLLGHTGICVDLAKSRHRLGVAGERGYIVPLQSGASGKTLLAAQPEELREQLLQELEPDRTRQRLLRNQLLKILQEGFCISEGEVDQGVAAIAMPLHLKDRLFVLTISGPVDRLRSITYPKLQQGLAETISRLEQKSALLGE
ncbi:IclR family transcriptional regulator [Acidaminococcus massiliensis]|uniref:IclR family transcriptional regulator n=1 Tax=Acidaminococcus massiliensis TaxID=1852375 RepID=UPI00094E1E65|nr:IclR family transcriptional regulator [Acidaminococcus massiliensis]